MSNLRHIVKRRVHLERSQPKGRQKKFGLLEKHKDYVLRARDYNRKKKTLQILREKARLKNPDEFHFKMIKSRVNENGRYEKLPVVSSKENSLKENLANRRLIEMKRSSDQKASEKSRECLHSIGVNSETRSHIIFKDEASETDDSDVDLAPPSSLLQTYAHEKAARKSAIDNALSVTESLVEEYENVADRNTRKSHLNKVLDTLETQKYLMEAEKRDTSSVIERDNGTKIYKFRAKRKK